ncbi:PF04577 domain protein [Acinetobacter sp. WC-323]|nr:PF04577 domain protein [Acinetobacter sp. WC-323]
MEDYDFNEQVAIFNNAEFIVGPSGAAWSNIIFCSSGCKAISWLPNHLAKFSIFSTLATLNDCDLKFITTSSDNPNDIHSSYYLDLEEIKKLYKNFDC